MRGALAFDWKGERKLPGTSNYFRGNNPRNWQTNVAHFDRVEAHEILPGVSAVVYGNAEGFEYDLRLSSGTKARNLKLDFDGAASLRLDAKGDLRVRAASAEYRVKKPAAYEIFGERRRPVRADYLLVSDRTVALRLGPHRQDSELVIDPSLSVSYSTFLGGAGDDNATGIALDSAGKLYLAGTTTSETTFPEAMTAQYVSGGGTVFYIAKIDPTLTGPSSLVYLTFIGGSNGQSGGAIAVDTSGNAAIYGTTTSADYPVTDGSQPTNSMTNGLNDVAVTQIGPAGSTLVYSTLFGGNGSEATQGSGGVAVDSSGEIFIAADTTSTNLPATAQAFHTTFGGGITDGFLAVLRPVTTPHLKYCTYLGVNAQVGIGGVAVDSSGNAYLAGFTSNPNGTFPTGNGFQTTYGGDPFDAFLVKIRPSGTGSADLAYGTLLGGSGLDKALAIAVGVAMPATAYVTGTTQSANFPVNGAIPPFQSGKKGLTGASSAFLAAVTADAGDKTSLLYSTYLGGSQTDTGMSVWFSAANAIYMAGKTTSWDFPWLNNFQPFNGDADAFVAKLDPTSSGQASLVYATPLGGTASPGITAVADGNAVAADTSGDAYVTGRTTAGNFPLALATPAIGFQQTCLSCPATPPLADAFIVAIKENPTPAPSVSFSVPKLGFGAQPVSAQNVPPLTGSILNTGDSPLNVNASALAITGANSPDFALISTEPCMSAPILPGATCSFEVGYTPTVVGPEQAFLTFPDDAPGSPQVLALTGTGEGPLAIPAPMNIDFGSQPQGTTSAGQTITLTNMGNEDLHVSVASLGGADPTQFNLQDNSCTGVTVHAGNSCSVGLVFAPSGTQFYQAIITFVDDSGGQSNAQQIIPLMGTGVPPAPVANLQPSSLTFGSQQVATASAAQTVTLTNTGSAPLTLTSIAITGSDALSFGIVTTGTNPCPLAGGIVVVSGSCTVAVDFAPQTVGAKTASLQLTDNAAGSPQSVSLSGTGVGAAGFQVSPTSINFGTQTVGVQSASQTVTITNTGQPGLSFSVTVSGANPSDFSASSQCPPVLAAGGNCLVTVIMNATAAGNRTATVNISASGSAGTQSVSVSGVAVVAGISFSPTSLSFAAQLAGTKSAAPLPVIITNTGQGTLLISQISLSGTDPGDFTESNNCAPNVQPGGSCTIQVTFGPIPSAPQCGSSPQGRCGTLTLTDNAPPGNPATISLNGTVLDFNIEIPANGSTSAVISPGNTATFALNLVSLGYSGTVNLSCSGAPPESNCNIQPPSTTIASNSSTPFQLSLSTTPPSSPPSTSARGFGRWASPGIAQLTLLGILLWLVAWRPFRRHPHVTPASGPRRAVLMAGLRAAVLILAVAGALASCGGGGRSDPSLNPGTPPGTYTLVATAQSGGVSRTIQLSLTLQ